MTTEPSSALTANLSRPMRGGTGFIYNNGKWATLNYPSSTIETMLSGISNANLIVGTTVTGRSSVTVTGSFLYKSGTFKKIVMPSSNVPTNAFGVARTKG